MIPSSTHQNNTLKHDIRIFVVIITLLIFVGLIFIYSASSVFALEKYKSSHFFLKKHCVGLAIGCVGLITMRLIPLTLIYRCSPLFFVIALLLTIMTQFSAFSVHIHGSSRWLNLFGVIFQPSELLKMNFVAYISYLLTKKNLVISSLRKAYIPLLIILAITSLVLLKQPDFGMTVTIALTAFMLMFIAQIPTQYLLTTLGASIPVVGILVFFKAYRLRRILTFLNPWADPQGAGFQVIQSLIAIGSGNWWGVGIAHSKQKFFYLPMQHTDFIVAIIAEETGFLGLLALIMLFVLFLYFGLRVALAMHNRWSMLVTIGFVIINSLQAIINIAVATGLAPTKGVGLPFVSYGNTALVTNLCMVGLIINCAHHEIKNKHHASFSPFT